MVRPIPAQLMWMDWEPLAALGPARLKYVSAGTIGMSLTASHSLVHRTFKFPIRTCH